jgi:hypothetical protein
MLLVSASLVDPLARLFGNRRVLRLMVPGK